MSSPPASNVFTKAHFILQIHCFCVHSRSQSPLQSSPYPLIHHLIYSKHKSIANTHTHTPTQKTWATTFPNQHPDTYLANTIGTKRQADTYHIDTKASSEGNGARRNAPPSMRHGVPRLVREKKQHGSRTGSDMSLSMQRKQNSRASMMSIWRASSDNLTGYGV